MNAARRTPLIAAIPKMLFPALLILPGMLAIALFSRGGLALPADANSTPDYNMVVPAMLAIYFPNGLLGIGLTALIASFMSGVAGNVTAFNTVWTYDLYQNHLKPDASDAHLVRVGRITTIAGLVISGGYAYLAASFNNIMDMLQLVFGLVNAPLFAIFQLGMFWRRATGHGAFYGLLLGTLGEMFFHGCTLPLGETAGIKGGWLAVQHTFAAQWRRTSGWRSSPSPPASPAHSSSPSPPDPTAPTTSSAASSTRSPRSRRIPTNAPWYARPVPLGMAVLATTLALNIIFW